VCYNFDINSSDDVHHGDDNHINHNDDNESDREFERTVKTNDKHA
jgi:hypothetical protein